MSQPTIITSPQLGLTYSAQHVVGKEVVDHRTPEVGLPYMHPESNAPEDDAHRINHSFKHIDAHLNAVYLASLIEIPYYFLLPAPVGSEPDSPPEIPDPPDGPDISERFVGTSSGEAITSNGENIVS